MGQLSVVESVSLDGVIQGLGKEDEDTRGGFAHGGWGQPYMDEVIGREMGKGMASSADEGSAMLFGRRTYAQFATFWPYQPADNPFTAHMTATTKHVVTETLRGPFDWANTETIRYADVPALKARVSLGVVGSGALVRSLLADGLVDSITLLIHPLLLGSGTRLFGEGDLTRFELVSSVPSTTGVIVATYRPTD
jgi:dihydrofolate reductase